EDGTYEWNGLSYGPDHILWHYEASKREDFYSDHISGAQRLPNGNTLVCSGAEARFFEVNPTGETVWEYLNPYEVQSPKGVKNSVFRAEKYAPDYEGLSSLNG
ncbi:MAG: hypothetical protein PQJ60_01515, partial [Spirochaetales bacterium]|nr:hypothetical protein [Spirochaetales bacterium]